MKRILFLDDDEDRHVRFVKMVIQTGGASHWITPARSAADCITALKLETVGDEKIHWDLLFLDFDLNMDLDISITGTGMDVVNFIDRVLEKEKWPAKIIIHSHNTDHAPEMEEQLKIAGHTNVTRLEFPSFFCKTDKEFNELLIDLLKDKE